MQGVELVDAKLVRELVGDVVAHVVQDARGLTLDGPDDGRGRGLDGADDATDTAKETPSGRRRGRGGGCGRGGGGSVAVGQGLDKVLAEGGCVEDDDVVVFHEALLAAGEQG